MKTKQPVCGNTIGDLLLSTYTNANTDYILRMNVLNIRFVIHMVMPCRMLGERKKIDFF